MTHQEGFNESHEVARSAHVPVGAVAITGVRHPEWLPTEHREMYDEVCEQIETSYSATNSMIAKINSLRDGDEQIQALGRAEYEEAAATKIKEWSENGGFDWAIAHKKEFGGRIVLVGTPSTPVTGDEFYRLGRNFRVNQYATSFADAGKDTYEGRPAEDISGKQQLDEVVNFSLMPTALGYTEITSTSQWGSRTVKNLRSKLAELQEGQPSLSDPTPLETWTYFQTLLESGEELTGDRVVPMTATTHVSMPVAGRGARVLHSQIYEIGRAEVIDMSLDTVGTLRASIH